MMGMLMKSNRRPPTTDGEQVVLFDEMLAFTGSVRSGVPGQLIITPDFSWNPEWGGDESLPRPSKRLTLL